MITIPMSQIRNADLPRRPSTRHGVARTNAACDLNVAIDLRALRQIPAPAADQSCAATSSAIALIGVARRHAALPRANPHSARGTLACHFPRFRSLKAFGRRPRCKPRRRHGPASETLNKPCKTQYEQMFSALLPNPDIVCGVLRGWFAHRRIRLTATASRSNSPAAAVLSNLVGHRRAYRRTCRTSRDGRMMGPRCRPDSSPHRSALGVGTHRRGMAGRQPAV